MNKRLFLASAALTAFLGIRAQGTVDVAIFSLNDFHGAFVRSDSKGIVGAPAIWQTLDSLKRIYPLNVTVSAGDNFGGSYFYNATHGQLLPVFFNDLGIRLSAVGNHEFDDGLRALADKWDGTPLRPEGWDITYVCANVREDATGRVPAMMQPVATERVTLPNGRDFHVAFVGLIASSTPQQVSKRRIGGLSFSGDYTAVLDSVLRLPEGSLVSGANLRLLLTHVGSRSTADGTPVWDDLDTDNLLKITDQPWQGILSSHTHKHVCGRINEAGLPIVQGRWHGDYISMLLCTVDTATMTVTRVEPRTVRVTPKAQLEPGPARLQAQIDSLLQHTTTSGGTPIGEALTRIDHDMPHDRDNKYVQTEVGALVCASYAAAYRRVADVADAVPVVGVSHFGSIRAGFTKGTVSVLDVGEALPFSNALRTFRLTGRQLLNLVEFGLHNQRFGWIQTSNLDIERDADGHIVRLAYVSPEGQRIAIKDKTKVFVVADEFMANGGDGYTPEQFPAAQEVKAAGMPATTDAFVDYLKTLTPGTVVRGGIVK